jgi:hypothetical protein
MKPGESIYHSLPCKLTRQEREERAAQMAKQHRELVESEEAAKTAATAAKEAQKDMKSHLARLARALETGSESRQVECIEEADIGKLEINTVRMDTGEIAWSRPMDPAEREAARQGQLFGRALAESEQDHKPLPS